MATASHQQLAFNAGVLSPQMSGRIDQDKYATGCETLENFLPLVEGPAQKRSGTQFIKEVKDSSKTTVLVPFEYSIEEAYVLEFGDLYMRPYRDGGVVLETDMFFAAAPTSANPVVIKITTHTYVTGDEVFITDSDMTELNGRFFVITRLDADFFELDDENGIGRDPATAVGVAPRVHTVVTTFGESSLSSIEGKQLADVLYLIAVGEQPAKVTRTADSKWTFEQLEFAEIEVTGVHNIAPPFRPLQTSTILMQKAPASSQVLASAAFFVAAHVGMYIKIQEEPGSWGYGLITSIVSPTTANISIYNTFPAAVTGAPGTRDWALNAFNSIDGYPRAIAIHQGRMWYGGTDSDPQTLWASPVNFYENFITYDSLDLGTMIGLQLTIAESDLNIIEWMAGGDPLVAGTRAGEFTIQGEVKDGEITQGNVGIKRRATYGSRTDSFPVEINSVLLFVQRAGKKIREFVYQFETDRYVAPNMVRLARHITDAGVAGMAFQQSPSRVIWVVLDDGSLLSFTYEREEGVAAWANQVIGGTDVEVKSLAVIPSSDETADELWMIVQRTIAGETKQYVELLQQDWTSGTDVEDAWFVDSGIKYDGAPVTSLTNLRHLAGETLTVFADGVKQGDRVPTTAGEITLETAASVVLVGLPYSARLRTMDLEAGAQRGVSQGRIKSIPDLVLRLDETGEGLEYGPDFEDMDMVDLRDLDDLSSTPVPMFSGDTERLEMPGGYDRVSRVALRHSLPYPCTLVAGFMTVKTEEG